MIDALQRQTFLTCLDGDFKACDRGLFPLALSLYAGWTLANYGRVPLKPRETDD